MFTNLQVRWQNLFQSTSIWWTGIRSSTINKNIYSGLTNDENSFRIEPDLMYEHSSDLPKAHPDFLKAHAKLAASYEDSLLKSLTKLEDKDLERLVSVRTHSTNPSIDSAVGVSSSSNLATPTPHTPVQETTPEGWSDAISRSMAIESILQFFGIKDHYQLSQPQLTIDTDVKGKAKMVATSAPDSEGSSEANSPSSSNMQANLDKYFPEADRLIRYHQEHFKDHFGCTVHDTWRLHATTEGYEILPGGHEDPIIPDSRRQRIRTTIKEMRSIVLIVGPWIIGGICSVGLKIGKAYIVNKVFS